MDLTFSAPYLSIISFPDITVPEFTLITGPNGGGKSHLLKAIEQGHVSNSKSPIPHFPMTPPPGSNTDVKYYDGSNLIPSNAPPPNVIPPVQERAQVIAGFMSSREAQYGRRGLPGPPQTDADRERNLLMSLPAASRRWLEAVSQDVHKPVMDLDEVDLRRTRTPYWGQAEIFGEQFSILFTTYRDAILQNNVRKLKASEGKEDSDFLTDEQFVARYGLPPWSVMNDILLEAELDLEVTAPDEYGREIYSPLLRKRSSNAAVTYQNLSSGEKVIVSLSFSLFNASEDRQAILLPKLLLLDEVDAPLHPSMARVFLRVVEGTLVKSFGVTVIATTHSPSTVALAPEASIFIMRPGQPGLHKTSKADALNALTEGVPTIALSYHGRRQVFVESPDDAEIYASIYLRIRGRLKSERSLEFIATGVRSSQGDENTGCDNVLRIVNQLVDAGNESVFGLLDWDGRREPSERIAVLAHGIRNGLENVMLDPLLLAAVICYLFPEQWDSLDPSRDSTWQTFKDSDQSFLQQATTSVCSRIFGDSIDEKRKSKYSGGFELELDRRVFETDDHEYEAMVLRAFPFFRSITKKSERCTDLIRRIVATVLRDAPGLLPLEIETCMSRLLKSESHMASSIGPSA